MALRIVAHISLGLSVLIYLGYSSQQLNEEEKRRPLAFVCRNAVYDCSLQDCPYPFFTLSETHPLLHRVLPDATTKALDWFTCFVTPAFVAMYSDPWGNAVIDLFNPVFSVLIAWAAVESLTGRSRGCLAKWIIKATPITFALGQIGAVSHVLLLPAILILRCNSEVTRLPTAMHLSTILVQTLTMIISMGITTGSPKSVMLWAIAFLQLSPVLGPLLYLTPCYRVIGLPFKSLFSKKSGHPLQTFWNLLAAVAILAHLQAVARIIALVLTYDSPTPAFYGVLPSTDWSSTKPPLSIAAIFSHLTAWHDQTELGRALIVYDFMLTSLALAALQLHNFSGIGDVVYYASQIVLLGPAGSFAIWQSRACEKDIAAVERPGKKRK
ncbi:hypothetical protein GLOTRDRAFT_125579 [Gloeophyllum trabeum ATCC 11539]|uniref:Uncharacterized protein n=1 Tax=Gloeophyllum trabeum (strain ATCC 11539 / FP-39264 / Madison 617) TaxID=670483 RepID=S7QIV6_GLOTA|nr:uncharacterized protein GLOTRDRAFT_125579 [Gloeophyllum trabeum ATCC 11539]EPQ59273.1 hypothetical protein GLOTRDRAFT_125579 [Gloeophyllum trabeum ATCC 11539]